MSKLHWQILNESQRKTLPFLKAFSRYGVSAGGTALALQLNHRKSYDFDIFRSGVPLERPFLYRVRKYYPTLRVLINTADELSFIAPTGVRVSFVYYPFKPLYPTIATADFRMASWKDISLDKAYTIGRRGEWRDYVDVYFILKHGFALADIISQAREKFGDTFSEKLFLSQLCYFGDIKDFTVEFMARAIPPIRIQAFFKQTVKAHFNK